MGEGAARRRPHARGRARVRRHARFPIVRRSGLAGRRTSRRRPRWCSSTVSTSSRTATCCSSASRARISSGRWCAGWSACWSRSDGARCRPTRFATILADGSPAPARLTAPPSGLFLEKVFYEGDAQTSAARRDVPRRSRLHASDGRTQRSIARAGRAVHAQAEHEADDFVVARRPRLHAVGLQVRIVHAPSGVGDPAVDVAQVALANRAQVRAWTGSPGWSPAPRDPMPARRARARRTGTASRCTRWHRTRSRTPARR